MPFVKYKMTRRKKKKTINGGKQRQGKPPREQNGRALQKWAQVRYMNTYRRCKAKWQGEVRLKQYQKET
jgi:hypothetical protein